MANDKLTNKILEQLKSCQTDMNELQTSRQQWLRYYNQDKTLYESPEGRSSVVTSDVHDVIEGMMPSLMDIFYGGTEIVSVSPQGPEDEKPAKLMTELLNYQFQRKIDGYKLIHDWFKDALLNKISFVKYWWDEETETEDKEYTGLNPAEMAVIAGKPNFSIVEVTENIVQEAVIDEYGMEVSPAVMTFDVIGTETTKESHPKVVHCPADEVVFNVREKCIKDADFVAHKKRIHRKQLKKYGLKESEIKSYSDNWGSDSLYEEMFRDLGGSSFWMDTEDDSDYVYIYECYIKDYSKGKKEYKKVLLWGDKVLKTEKNSYKRPPFCVLSPILMPGRMVGRGIAELITENQDIATALNRAVLDNIYYQNLGQKIVNPFRIEIKDLLTGNRPGGIIRTKDDINPNTAVFPVPISPLPQQIFNMIELNEAQKENKAGYNKYASGSDSREVNRTATGVAILSANAQKRVTLIARNFAETGVKDLFNEIVRMNIEYLDGEVAIRLNKEWAQISRESIQGSFDLIVDVGLGTGSKELAVQQKMSMLQMAPSLMPIGVMIPENVKEIVTEIWQDWGYKNTQRFVASQEQTGQVMAMQMGGANGGATAGGGGTATGGGSLPSGGEANTGIPNLSAISGAVQDTFV